MRQVLLALMVLVSWQPLTALAQPVPDALLESARRSATRMQEAAKRADWETLADLTHPRLIALMGGRKKAVAVMRKEGGAMRITSVRVGRPTQSVRVGASAVQLVLSSTVRVMVDGDELESVSSLIGFTADEGKTWTFANVPDPKTVRQLLPELSPSLKLEPQPDATPVKKR